MAFDYAAKIQALLANADDERISDAARQAYRDKAEKLMVQYRIDEETALATDADNATTPITRKIRLTTGYRGVLDQWYYMVFGAIARHTGVRFVSDWEGNGEVATVVGYEGDVRYAEFLWTAADEAKWQRAHNSPSARAGHASGRDAAEGVLIQRGHDRPARMERGSDRSAIES